jgi:hypothetical protein
VKGKKFFAGIKQLITLITGFDKFLNRQSSGLKRTCFWENVEIKEGDIGAVIFQVSLWHLCISSFGACI